ncbi:hypothetical protein SAMN06297387_10944 [Streptomyces zhaozhouensis]|uniref:Proteins of 100 residues with WXG n=1 Tax=Streptomyces zhaozhouensis TaxID=1300267 RepID=A0A286DWU2_9ACTN|nr:hypothetical protein [Streptomyces zhaozhouensis]SOD63103.1 hypothetical protein SAMN06297387_10944 [Streptomyces zhaozhouensis]
MGTRPADWQPLTDDGRDPVPGDWEMVQEAAARYRRTADAIQRAKELLEDVTDSEDGWRSEAGTAFREKSTEVSDDVWKAWGRYDAAADALAGYWPALEDAQTESLTLRTEAQEVQAQMDSLSGRIEGAEADAERAGDSDADDAEDREEEANRQVSNLQGQLEYQQGELNRLRTRLSEIVEAKDQAAQRAADAIGDFIGGDGLKDGFWDHVGAFFDGLKDFLIMIGEWAGRIAAICGVLALLVSWIPVVGQALAAVLGTIALVATVFSMVGNALSGNWVGFALDVVGIVTFGIGRAVTPMLRAAGGTARFGAFRSVMQNAAGNRAARNAIAAGVVGDGATLAARAGTTFTRPSGLLGWGRSAFGGLGGEMAGNLRVLGSGSNWGQGISGMRGAFSGVGFRGGVHQFFGQADAADDLAALGRASARGVTVGELGASSSAAIGAAGAGAISGNIGLFGVTGVDSLWNWPGLGDGDHPLVGDFTEAGDLTYDESEAMAR